MFSGSLNSMVAYVKLHRSPFWRQTPFRHSRHCNLRWIFFHFGVEISISVTALPRNLKCYIIRPISKEYNLYSGLIAQGQVSLWGVPQDCPMTNLTHMCNWWLRYPDGQNGHVICLFLYFRGPWIQWWHLLSCTGHHFRDRPNTDIRAFVTYVKFSVNLGSNFRYQWRPSQGICNATLSGQFQRV